MDSSITEVPRWVGLLGTAAFVASSTAALWRYWIGPAIRRIRHFMDRMENFFDEHERMAAMLFTKYEMPDGELYSIPEMQMRLFLWQTWHDEQWPPPEGKQPFHWHR